MDSRDLLALERRVAKLEAQQARQMPKANVSTSAPTVNDDVTLGFGALSLWLHTTPSPPDLYVCMDNANGAADWDLVTTS